MIISIEPSHIDSSFPSPKSCRRAVDKSLACTHYTRYFRLLKSSPICFQSAHRSLFLHSQSALGLSVTVWCLKNREKLRKVSSTCFCSFSTATESTVLNLLGAKFSSIWVCVLKRKVWLIKQIFLEYLTVNEISFTCSVATFENECQIWPLQSTDKGGTLLLSYESAHTDLVAKEFRTSKRFFVFSVHLLGFQC